MGESLKRLVTITDDARDPRDRNSHPEDERGVFSTDEIYFPLPANNEQKEIVEKLVTRQGVLVQGPPGTGKSHTIANLISHLLATGKRVLITSHTPRALKVLQGKIPREVSALCVSLLGNDLSAMQALEDSVQGITERFNSWSGRENRRRVENLEKQLRETRKREAEMFRGLRMVREGETKPFTLPFGDYRGTLQAIAFQLREEEAQYGWLSMRPSKEQEPPLTTPEVRELLKLLREIDAVKEEELKREVIDLEQIVSPPLFTDLVGKEKEAAAQYQEAKAVRNHPCYGALAEAPEDLRVQLLRQLDAFRTAYEAVMRSAPSLPWIKEAVVDILSGQDAVWRELFNVNKVHLEKIQDRVEWASECRISGLEGRERSVVKAQAIALLNHLEAGGKIGWGPFRHKVVKEGLCLVKEVYVNGKLCNEVQALKELLDWIEVTDCLEALKDHWSQHTESPAGTGVLQAAAYQNWNRVLEQAFSLQEKVSKVRHILGRIPGISEPVWHLSEELQALQEATESVTLEETLKRARSVFENLAQALQSILVLENAHPIVGQLLKAIEGRDEKAYREEHSLLCALQIDRENLARRQDLSERLKGASPELALDLENSFDDSTWDSRLKVFEAAWNWARADRRLTQLNDPKALERLSQGLEDCRRQIQMLMADLAAAKAWEHCFRGDRLTEHTRQHLIAWTKAVRRIGKGTGKYAPMHRRAAREHMNECRSAIPAWIMPIYRVAETIRPGTDSFDVVIVDEASQSGPEALFLQYLAKKIIVVGDDKQISPEFIGITREDIELLRQRHISDLPHSDSVGIDSSFFDQAEIRYGGRIRLREHFRCMPEIIQFSNNLCYQAEPLIPLRQYGAQRLEPIVTRQVEGGYLEGRRNVVNPPEAEALVETVVACCSDPLYSDRTMGVISMQGPYQAHLIERLLLEQLGPEEFERRNLHCGDAYDFQGDERDVMFLSMVAGPMEDRRIGTLASARDERRFNVAVSRAKDQLWLFHTATLDDLSPKGLRYKLLEYCLNPRVETRSVEDIDVKDLKEAARTQDRNVVSAPSSFDSWFEVDVFLKIVDRGYRVIPQFNVNRFSLDLVVEGLKGRLAVECDGDKWHGPDRYEYDMGRQRQLERCGWTFWRVRGSSFYRDPDGSLEDLWNTLSHLEIYPDAGAGVSGPQEGEREENEAAVQSEPVNVPDSSTPEHSTDTADLPEPDRDEGQLEQKDKATSPYYSGRGQPELLPEMPFEMIKPHRGSSSFDKAAKPDRVENGPHENLESGIDLASYRNWTKKALLDPRVASLKEITDGLIEIVAEEGPMLCRRAYHLYAEAVGIQRVGRSIQSLFNRAVYQAVRSGRLEQHNECGKRGQVDKTIRLAGTPSVSLRTRGDRMLHEIPPSEIAMLMEKLLSKTPDLDKESLFRAVLACYNLVRLTQSAQKTLEIAHAFYKKAGDS